MNIYIWDGALADYTGGLIVVIAPNLEAAKETVRKDFVKEGYGPGTNSALEQDLKSKPEIVRITETMRPRTWWTFGGG